MTLRQLAEIAALVALHGSQVVSDGVEISDAALGPYLSHSQERGRRWRAILQRLTDDSLPDRSDSADELVALLSEVLVTEMLTRVWTAVLAGSDSEASRVHAEPVARHVLLGVLQTRAKILHELLGGHVYPLGTLLQVDFVRRKCDRWTDLLIGELSLSSDVLRYAIDRTRARDFRDHSRSERAGERSVTWSLLQAGLSRAMPDCEVSAESAVAQHGVVTAILSTLPATPFGEQGLLRVPAVWRVRHRPRQANEQVPPAIAARLRSNPDSVSGGQSGAAELLSELLRRLESGRPDAPPDDAPRN